VQGILNSSKKDKQKIIEYFNFHIPIDRPLLESDGEAFIESFNPLLFNCEVILCIGLDILFPIPNIRSLLRSAIRGIEMA
jgi:hypothetical protein